MYRRDVNWSAAITDPHGEALVAEGLLTGALTVWNRFVFSPGGLRWISTEGLAAIFGDSCDPADLPTPGAWVFETGFVATTTPPGWPEP
jgi:hypothetical protein